MTWYNSTEARLVTTLMWSMTQRKARIEEWGGYNPEPDLCLGAD